MPTSSAVLTLDVYARDNNDDALGTAESFSEFVIKLVRGYDPSFSPDRDDIEYLIGWYPRDQYIRLPSLDLARADYVLIVHVPGNAAVEAAKEELQSQLTSKLAEWLHPLTKGYVLVSTDPI